MRSVYAKRKTLAPCVATRSLILGKLNDTTDGTNVVTHGKTWIENNSWIPYLRLKWDNQYCTSLGALCPIRYLRPWPLAPAHSTLCLLWNKVEIDRRSWVEKMSMVRKLVTVKSRVDNTLWKWVGVEDKEQRPEYWALENTEIKSRRCSGHAVCSDSHKAVSDVGV